MKCIEALEEAIMFFEENMSDYPYLRSDMYIYLYLKDDIGKVCTLNDSDYRFNGEKLVDTAQERIETGKKKLLYDMYVVINRGYEAVSNAEAVIEHYKKYLYRAEIKGFSTAETWRKEIEKVRKRIDGEYAEEVKTAGMLKQCLEANELVFHVRTETDSYNKLVSALILPEIDPDCKTFKQPIYFASGEFCCTKPDYSEWYKV